MGERKKPPRLGRRQFLKQTGAAIVWGMNAMILQRTLDAIIFSHNLPETKNRVPAKRRADYGILTETIPSVGDNSNTARILGQTVFGDSVAFGLYETYTSDLQLRTGQLCPTSIFCHDLTKSNISDYTGVKFTFVDYIAAFPGATFEDIKQQVDTFASKFAPDAEAIPYDFVFAIGGNFALNWLANIMTSPNAINVVSEFQLQFLPEFQIQMEFLLKKILQLTEKGSAIGDIKHIFVTGIPDIGKSSQLFISTDPNTRAQQVNMNIPGLRGLATAVCTRMNAAILDAIENIQLQFPTIPILFEDISDIPILGIHPTEEGYKIIANRREERCRGIFPRVNELPHSAENYGYSTFRDVVVHTELIT